MRGGTTNGDPLPTPDATSTLNLSGTGGQIYLANSATGIDPGTGAISNPSVIDFLGWGTSTTSFETAAASATRQRHLVDSRRGRHGHRQQLGRLQHRGPDAG